jgi:transposase
MDIREMLNHIRAGSSNRQIAQDIGVDRRTVQRYRQWAQEQGLLEARLPLTPKSPSKSDSLATYRTKDSD